MLLLTFAAFIFTLTLYASIYPTSLMYDYEDIQCDFTTSPFMPQTATAHRVPRGVLLRYKKRWRLLLSAKTGNSWGLLRLRLTRKHQKPSKR